MKTHVLVETNQSAIMLAKILGAEQDAGLIEIRAAGPASSLYSAARTLLAVRGEPVALVLDADSTYPEAIERRRLIAEEVVGDVASSAPFRVLVAVPALEALLFARPDPVVRAFGAAVVDERLLEMGRMNPREALRRLDPAGKSSNASVGLVRVLDDRDVAELRSIQPIEELLEFLGSLWSNEIAAGAQM